LFGHIRKKGAVEKLKSINFFNTPLTLTKQIVIPLI